MKKQSPTRSKTKKVRILLVDDHPILREGVAQRINNQTDMEVCGEAGDAHAALDAIGQLDPDLVVVDIALKDTNGLELVKDIKVRYSRLPVIVLSVHDELQYAERAMQAGAKGYLMKQADPALLERAIRQVLEGQVFVSDQVTKKILNRVAGLKGKETSSPLEMLSDREVEVFELIGQGYDTREISERLHLSVKTVATHRENIKHKLKLKTTAEVVRAAIPWFRDHGDR